MIVHASKNSQLWVTTHSARLAELIERHSGEPSIRLELVNGETRAVGQKLVFDQESDENRSDSNHR